MIQRVLLVAFLIIASLEAKSQISVGLRDTKYVFASINYCKHWNAKIEQSLYSEQFGLQKIRLYTGYSNRNERYSGEFNTYISSLVNGNYQDFGAQLKLNVVLFPPLHFDFILNPHYDTTVYYETCYCLGSGIKITEDISFLLHYSTIPEFRIPEKRIRIGTRFLVKKLSVTPELSISTGSVKTIRTICSMEYVF